MRGLFIVILISLFSAGIPIAYVSFVHHSHINPSNLPTNSPSISDYIVRLSQNRFIVKKPPSWNEL